jgi:hypothetical protein
MQSWRGFFANSATVFASLLFISLVLEVGLRFFPVAWAPDVWRPTLDDTMQRYEPNETFTWSHEWNFQDIVRGRTNAQGWIADYDYDAKASTPLLAVVGDSYVEALRVPFAETVTGRLQVEMESRGRVYAFAQSGAPLSQYVAYANYACTHFHPDRMVVTTVGNDYDESVVTHRKRNGFFHLYPRSGGGFDYKLTPLPPPGIAQRILRHSALALYLIRNVGITGVLDRLGFEVHAALADPSPFVGNTSSDANPARVKEGEDVVAWFVTELSRAACLEPKNIVIVVDAMRPEIYMGEDVLTAARVAYFSRMRETLMAAAKERGYVVVDMEPHFRAAYARDGRRFEFIKDWHWSAHGHEVVTAAVREALAGWPPLAATSSARPRLH